MKNALEIVQDISQLKYSQAKAIFWSGSVARNKFQNTKSDLDLVVVYDQLDTPYREAFIYNNWPIDVFVNDEKSLRNFFELNRQAGIPGLLSMVSDAIEVPFSTEYSQSLKQHALNMLSQGPLSFTSEEIIRTRFFITDLLDDITESHDMHEQLALVMRLYGLLATLYLRGNNQWVGDGKHLVRFLEVYNKKMADVFFDSFDCYFKTKQVEKIVELVDEILDSFGGRLWDGFYLKAS